jgi:hypothetical protein
MIKALFTAIGMMIISSNCSAHADDKLIKALKSGGYNIFFRHSITDGSNPNKINPPDEKIGDCNSQRQLNTRGKEQAKSIGRNFRAHSIPVGEVYSSPFCRCEETAKLAFGKALVVNWMIVRRRNDRLGELEKHLKSVPSARVVNEFRSLKNNIYVGHAITLTQSLLGPDFPIISLREGEGIVFDPRTNKYLGRIYPGSWSDRN